MKEKKYKRAHLRAPLKSQAICSYDEKVCLGKTLNISEGGLLITDLDNVPEPSSLYFMVDLPSYPNLSEFGKEEILNLDWNSFERDVLRMDGSIVRSFDYQGEKLRGCSFSSVSEGGVGVIKNYVKSFSENIVYLLELFESLGRGDLKLSILRKVAFLLGYDSDEKIFLMRKRVLHDYQSLEKL